MVKCILDIGNAKYKINRDALSLFIQEAQQQAASASASGADGCREQSSLDCEAGSFLVDVALETIFREVMQLYHEYARSESLDVLVRLKSKLEQVSLRYHSLALAEEVMNINSCLPYERRVRSNDFQSGSEGDAVDAVAARK